MITLFTEDDIISFGQYMLSDLREAHIRNNAPEDKVEEALKSVNSIDLAHWAHLITSKKNNDES